MLLLKFAFALCVLIKAVLTATMNPNVEMLCFALPRLVINPSIVIDWLLQNMGQFSKNNTKYFQVIISMTT